MSESKLSRKRLKAPVVGEMGRSPIKGDVESVSAMAIPDPLFSKRYLEARSFCIRASPVIVPPNKRSSKATRLLLASLDL